MGTGYDVMWGWILDEIPSFALVMSRCMFSEAGETAVLLS